MTALGGRTGAEALVPGARQQVGQALRGVWSQAMRDVPEQALKEIPEEFFDEMTSTYIQAVATGQDPQESLRGFLQQAPEFVSSVMLMGGAGGAAKARRESGPASTAAAVPVPASVQAPALTMPNNIEGLGQTGQTSAMTPNNKDDSAQTDSTGAVAGPLPAAEVGQPTGGQGLAAATAPGGADAPSSAGMDAAPAPREGTGSNPASDAVAGPAPAQPTPQAEAPLWSGTTTRGEAGEVLGRNPDGTFQVRLNGGDEVTFKEHQVAAMTGKKKPEVEAMMEEARGRGDAAPQDPEGGKGQDAPSPTEQTHLGEHPQTSVPDGLSQNAPLDPGSVPSTQDGAPTGLEPRTQPGSDAGHPAPEAPSPVPSGPAAGGGGSAADSMQSPHAGANPGPNQPLVAPLWSGTTTRGEQGVVLGRNPDGTFQVRLNGGREVTFKERQVAAMTGMKKPEVDTMIQGVGRLPATKEADSQQQNPDPASQAPPMDPTATSTVDAEKANAPAQEEPLPPPRVRPPPTGKPEFGPKHPIAGSKPVPPPDNTFTQEALDISEREMEKQVAHMKAYGHAWDRHGPDVTDDQLALRAMHKIDPITQTKEDGEHPGKKHNAAKHATQFTSSRALVQAKKFVEASPEFQVELKKAKANNIPSFPVSNISIEAALGPNYKTHVRGKTLSGSKATGLSIADTDLTNGYLKIIFKLDKNTGDFTMYTIYPNPLK